MPDPDYLAPYREAAQKHGDAFETTGWVKPDTQALRFRVFTEMFDLTGCRVLDAGCSRGDLAAWLIEHRIEFAHYTGVDAIENVIEYARGRDLPRCEFRTGDFITNPSLLRDAAADVVCISGALNTMTDREARATLQPAWDAAGKALLFNFLSDRAGPGATLADPARRQDTFGLLDWALQHTARVGFRQDYFDTGHDATILMLKPDPEADAPPRR